MRKKKALETAFLKSSGIISFIFLVHLADIVKTIV